MKNKALLLLLALLTLAGCSRTPCEDLTREQLLTRKDCHILVPVYPNGGYYKGENSTIYNDSYYYPNPLLPPVPLSGSNGIVSSPAPTQRPQTHKLPRQTAVERQRPTQPKKSASTQSNQAAPPPPPPSPTQSNRQRVTPPVSPTQPSRSTGRVGGSNFSSPRPSSSSRPPSSSRPSSSSPRRK